MTRPPRIDRTLVEWSLLAYLFEIAFARGLEPWLRDIPLVVLSLGLAVGVIRDRHTRDPSPPFELKIPILIFFGSFVLTIAASESFWPSLYRASYLPIALLVFFSAQYVFVDVNSFRRLSIVLSGVVFLIAVDGVVQMATGESLLGNWPLYSNTTRIRAGLPHPNDLSMLAVLIPIALMPLFTESSWSIRVVVASVLPLVIITAVASRSRNTWVGLTCAFGVLLLLTRFRKALGVVGIFVVLLLAFAWTFDVGRFATRIASLGNLEQEGRIGIWLTSLEMFKQHPWLGIGPNLFADFYLSVLDTTPLPDGYQPEKAYIPWAHNLYLEALAERGVVGLMAMGFVIAAAIRRVFMALQRAGNGPQRNYAVALASSWTAFLVMGLFDLTFLKDWVLLVFVLLVALSGRLEILPADDRVPEPSTPGNKQKSLPEG